MNIILRIPLVILSLLIIIVHNNISNAQSFLNVSDISQVKVEQLTEGEIKQLRAEMEKKNISIDALQKIATEKGMKASDFSILKNRLENEAPPSNVEIGTVIPEQPIEMNAASYNNPKAFTSKIFGSELFTNPSLSFEPNSNMATPVNYILGTGDELQIVIYGIQQFSTSAAVSKEGKIDIPNVGQLNVNGLTFEAATSLIKNAAAKIFTSIRSGQSNVSVTLTKIRTIKVTIIGSKKAGNYSLSSLSTVFNALYVAGGPDDNGSYRNIELIRGNKVIKKIDIYKFIVYGDQSDNIGLRDNDIIRIPVYNCRVSIEGKVKKEGVFELIPGESFNDLLKYCDGFNESAYLSSIKLIQNTVKELKIIDLSKNEYENYQPKSGDVFKVGELLNRFENRISIKGAVYRPDDYSFVPGLRVSDLISKADGLTEDAYRTRAQITRLKNDFSKEIISINLDSAISGDSLNNILLKKEDELLVYSLLDFKDVLTVQIDGQIRKPGIYPYVDNLTLFDLIIQAGNFNDVASKRLEISRVIKKDQVIKDQTQIATLFVIEIDSLLSDKSKNILLEPNDVIEVRKIPVFTYQKSVSILGFVEYPGNYTITDKNEKIIDLINRAGGLKSDANPKGIFITRGNYTIPINYLKISRKPNSIENIRIQPGDQINVLKLVKAIKIIGSVALNTEIPFVTRKHLKYYINSAGGIDRNGWKKKIYVNYPNGTTRSTKRFLFIKFYPKIEEGSVINIPTKPEKKERDGSDFITIASVSTSMTTMIAVLSQIFK